MKQIFILNVYEESNPSSYFSVLSSCMLLKNPRMIKTFLALFYKVENDIRSQISMHRLRAV